MAETIWRTRDQAKTWVVFRDDELVEQVRKGETTFQRLWDDHKVALRSRAQYSKTRRWEEINREWLLLWEGAYPAPRSEIRPTCGDPADLDDACKNDRLTAYGRHKCEKLVEPIPCLEFRFGRPNDWKRIGYKYGDLRRAFPALKDQADNEAVGAAAAGSGLPVASERQAGSSEVAHAEAGMSAAPDNRVVTEAIVRRHAELAPGTAPETEPPVDTSEDPPPRRGPKTGATGFAAADRALFPEIERMRQTGEARSTSAAALLLATSGKVAGVGAGKSRAQRLARHFGQWKSAEG